MTLGRVLGLVLGILFDFGNRGRVMVAKASKVPTSRLRLSNDTATAVITNRLLPGASRPNDSRSNIECHFVVRPDCDSCCCGQMLSCSGREEENRDCQIRNLCYVLGLRKPALWGRHKCISDKHGPIDNGHASRCVSCTCQPCYVRCSPLTRYLGGSKLARSTSRRPAEPGYKGPRLFS
jgi:hypothetical protein